MDALNGIPTPTNQIPIVWNFISANVGQSAGEAYYEDREAVQKGRFLSQEKLTIEVLTATVTRYPNDPRELGIAIKELRLGK